MLIDKIINNPTKENTQSFWEEVKRFGAPLVEKKDDLTSYVTVLFRKEEGVKNVQIFGEAFGTSTSIYLDLIEGTDIFYKTFEMENDIRSLYVFIINEEENEAKEADEDVRSDKLNPKINKCTVDPEFPEEFVVLFPEESILEMPNYNSKYSKEYIMKYHLDEGHFYYNDTKKRVWKYNTTETNEIRLIFFDGFEYAFETSALQIIDKLIEKRNLNIEAIFIDNRGNRLDDLNCDEDYQKVIVNEFLNVNITKILIGFSLGSNTALDLCRKDDVNRVLLQSGAFYWDPREGMEKDIVVKRIKQYNLKNKKVFMSVGDLEKEFTDFYKQVLNVKNTLEKNNSVKFQTHKGGHTYYDCDSTLEEGLLFLIEE